MDQRIEQKQIKSYFIKKRSVIIPHWLKRELAVFAGMLVESGKFIIVSILVFISVYGIINAPAVWNNARWWWYVNYVDDHTGGWWGIHLPGIGGKAEPNNTLFIPKIGVEAPIMFAQSKKPAEINKLLLDGVVHYPDTANPGEIGNVFITGHSSYYWWSRGEYNTIFSILDKLVIGDIIYIHYDYKRYTYKVYEVEIVSPSDTSVLQQGDNSILTLMTCTPVGTNYRRLIVRAQQISPDPRNNKTRKTQPQLPST